MSRIQNVNQMLSSTQNILDEALLTDAKGLRYSPVNLPTIEPVGLSDADIEQLAWAEQGHEEFMAQLERELLLGLPFNENAIPVCLQCRSPLNHDGNCDFCGQRADMPLPSNQFFLKF